LPLLKTVEHQLHAARHAEFFENSIEIIPHDLMLSLGWSPRRVALACYAITIVVVLAALFVLRTDITHALWVLALCVVALLVAALRLGSLHTSNIRLRMQRMKI
jgi:hypothetical protein